MYTQMHPIYLHPNPGVDMEDFFYLGENSATLSSLNGSIYFSANIIKNVMSSAAEAEIAAVFVNAKELIPIRNTLAELGHPQPPTTIQTDNVVAEGFIKQIIKQRKSKSICMNYYWLQDQQNQRIIDIIWRPKHLNIADYFAKHQPPLVHQQFRSILLHLP